MVCQEVPIPLFFIIFLCFVRNEKSLNAEKKKFWPQKKVGELPRGICENATNKPSPSIWDAI